jgi:transmembrane sensor
MTDYEGQATQTVAPESLDREALAWVGRLVSGEATIAELEDVKRWRRQSPFHEAAFARAARLWDKLGPAGQNAMKRDGMANWAGRFSGTNLGVGRRALLAGAVAASAAAAYVAVRPPLGLWPSLSEFTADYQTRTGEQRRVEMAGGVSVNLNTETSLNVQPAANNTVQIELVSGEAAIANGADAAQSVVVIAGDGRISASNARFDIRHDSSVACVTCIEGEIRVERPGIAMVLQARQQVAYAGRGLSRVTTIDPAVVSAWQDGLLVFHDTPLAEVVMEINRYRRGRIILLNAELGRRPVNARFHIDHADEVMTLVRRVFGAQVRPLPGGLVLLS